jgi:two-component system chemotaxis response regulator CheY
LELNDFDVSEADNPEHSAALWTQQKPDLVLANWYASGAHWFFETIRKHPSRPKTRLIAFLVENDPGEIESAVQAGADGFLLKPFTRETLEAMLDEIGLRGSEPFEVRPPVSDEAALPAIITPELPECVLEFSDGGQPGRAEPMLGTSATTTE